VDRTLTPDELEARFTALLPDLRYAAWQLGYALAVHGTMRRDLDLVGVPWIEGAGSGDQLVEALAHVLGDCHVHSEEIKGALYPIGSKAPHGIRKYVIYPHFHFGDANHHTVGYIELAVVPRG
jgi:hypothetical protein